jgi:hypothetical protein
MYWRRRSAKLSADRLFLEEIETSPSIVKSGSERILGRVETMRVEFIKQIGTLDVQPTLLRKLLLQ